MTKNFIRRISNRYSKLGKRRKKKQVWRRPTGRDNKMREKRKGYPKTVSIGYKKPKKNKTKIIQNLKDLEKIGKEKLILGNIGKKKKIEIIKKARERKIQFRNVNINKFLKEIEKKESKKKEKKNEPLKKIPEKIAVKPQGEKQNSEANSNLALKDKNTSGTKETKK
ncbi:MAG: eL32 family ribosomal protein [Nanoarchaeota archaeon]|nr:eL32 family ribosomal protein [Nanoarchaeota archaeon]MBU1028297.1 eL32 family ribosomal protein [Nanoarchaeota archaeon]